MVKKIKKPEINQFGAFPVPKPVRLTDYEQEREDGLRGIAKRLYTFFEEKELGYVMFEIEDADGNTHFIDNESVIQLIYMAPDHEIRKVYDMIVYLDFRNANINDYLAHLAKCYIQTSGFNVFTNPNEIGSAKVTEREAEKRRIERENYLADKAFVEDTYKQVKESVLSETYQMSIVDSDNPFA